MSQLETMNINAMATYNQLQGSMAYKAKEAAELAANNGAPKKKGMFGMMGSLLKSAFTSPKSTNPQADLDELAMYYQALNYADIMALNFLTRNCKEDGLLMPSMDPALCDSYILLLIKSIEGRLGTVSSQYMYSDNLVKAPPEWPEHAIEMLKALEEYKATGGEYSMEKSLIRTMKDKEEGKGDNRVPLRIPEASPVEVMKRSPPPSRQKSFDQSDGVQKSSYQQALGYNQGGPQGYNQAGTQGYNQEGPQGYNPGVPLGYNQRVPQGYKQGVPQGYYTQEPGQCGSQGPNNQMNQGGPQQDNLNNPPYQNNVNNQNMPSNIIPMGQLPFNFDKMIPVAFVPASSLKLDQLKTQANVVAGQQDTSTKSEVQPQESPQVQVIETRPQAQTQPQAQIMEAQPQKTQPHIIQSLLPQVQQGQPLVQSQVMQGQSQAQPQIVSSRIIIGCPDVLLGETSGRERTQEEERYNFDRERERYNHESNNLKPKSVIEKSPPIGSDPRLERLYE